ncbi:MAG: sigma-54-dependent Fis family transcriptional regulator, partial [Thermoanaerobaculia bacterium]|nr:sigma-54-dependent Fis family transcriptional regulator [Thermoanaerobaculia bacterium]
RRPPYSPERLGLVGDSESIARVRQDILRVADLGVSVLLRGETGTGKELVARAIHDASRRRRATYLSVNVGAIPATLATSELFGSAKGSFTGAVKNQEGYFLRAQGGTLFLDEIGEAPAEVQIMLLRVLETGEIQRVGAQEPQKVDVRLIAATDADLEAAIEQGTFKGPLLHRLASYEILLPPLRDRRDDFGRLLFHFLRLELEEIGEVDRLEPSTPRDQPWMPASIVARLARFDWPGNVRQLRNTVRQLVIGSRGSDSVHVGPQVERLLNEVTATRRPTSAAAEGEELSSPARRARASTFRKPSEVSEEEMIEVLRENRWELKPAAEQLGVSRASLYVLVEASAKVRKASELTREEILAGLAQCGGNLDLMVDHLEVSKRGLQMRMKQLEMS